MIPLLLFASGTAKKTGRKTSRNALFPDLIADKHEIREMFLLSALS